MNGIQQLTNKLRTAQRAMERKMLGLTLQDKTPCSEIRKRTKIIDIIEFTLKQKWNRKATDRRQWKTLMEGYISGWTKPR